MARKINLTDMQKFGFTHHPTVSRAYQKTIQMSKKAYDYFFKNNEEYQMSLYRTAGLNKQEKR